MFATQTSAMNIFAHVLKCTSIINCRETKLQRFEKQPWERGETQRGTV